MEPYASTTALRRILDASPRRECVDLIQKFKAETGTGDDDPLPLLAVLDYAGYHCALRVLVGAMPDDRLARHFQAWCAEQVLPLFEAERPGDRRVRGQIAMLRRDDATQEQRLSAQVAARDAALDAERASLAVDASVVPVAAYAALLSVAWGAALVPALASGLAAQEAQLRKMLGA